jgi:hypothetical protein
LGEPTIEPPTLLSVGGDMTLAFLFCSVCVPPWQINQVRLDAAPWSECDDIGVDYLTNLEDFALQLLPLSHNVLPTASARSLRHLRADVAALRCLPAPRTHEVVSK